MPLKATLRKVPTWGWLVVGGAGLGIGYRLYQDRRTGDAQPGSAGEEDLLATDPGYMVSDTPVPYGVQAPVVVQPEGGASEVGSIGQTAIETVIGGITGVIEGLPAIIEASRPEPIPVQVALPATPAPGSQPVQQPGPVVATPAQPPSVTILGRRFPGAYRYSEVSTPNMKARDFNVYYHKPHKDERWRRSATGTWSKIAEGNFGG